MKSNRRPVLKIVTKKITEKAGNVQLEMNSDNQELPYKNAYLNDANGDMNRRWLIEFHVYSAPQKKLVRKQLTVPKKLLKKERYSWAQKKIEAINELLQSGYHIKEETTKAAKQNENSEFDTILKALQNVLEIRKANFRHDSYRSFKTTVNRFEVFCNERKYISLATKNFQKKHVVEFLDWAQLKYGFGNRTRNHYKEYIVTLCNNLVSRGHIEENPSEGIKKERYDSIAPHVCFDKEEIKLILETVPFWFQVVCLLVYYCFIRPKEIRFLQVKHVNLDERSILVPANISKNRKSLHVTIPPPLLLHLQKYLSGDPKPEHYLFSKNLKPGAVVQGKEYLRETYRKYRQQLGISPTKHLYSFKHTGNRDAYLAGVDIKSLQMQNRHHSLSETDKYLQELGLRKNLQIDKFPEL